MKSFVFILIFALSAVVTIAQSKSRDNQYHLDKEYAISANGKFTLNCSDAKVMIKGSARSTAHVKIDYEVVTKGFVFGTRDFSIEVNESNGNLSVEEHSSGSVSLIGYNSERYVILVELPLGVSLNINGDDGDFEIENIKGAIDMTVDDGDINLTNCLGDHFRFRMDDGDLAMNTAKGTIDIDADDADVEIKNAAFENVLADIDDGDLIIETALADNGNYRINSQDGLVSLFITDGGGSFSIRHEDGHVTALGKFETLEESEDFTKLKLLNGHAKIDIRADDARVRLTAKN